MYRGFKHIYMVLRNEIVVEFCKVGFCEIEFCIVEFYEVEIFDDTEDENAAENVK